MVFVLMQYEVRWLIEYACVSALQPYTFHMGRHTERVQKENISLLAACICAYSTVSEWVGGPIHLTYYDIYSMVIMLCHRPADSCAQTVLVCLHISRCNLSLLYILIWIHSFSLIKIMIWICITFKYLIFFNRDSKMIKTWSKPP